MNQDSVLAGPTLPSAQFLSPNRDIQTCQAPFELIGLTLIQKGSLEVTGAVARALLNDDGQLLARLCVSGAREGRFVPVVGWLELVEKHVNILAKTLRKHMDQLPFVLNTFSRALLSPSFNVITAASNVLSALTTEIAQSGFTRELNVWIMRSGALKVMIEAAENVQNAASAIFGIVHSCAHQQYHSLFTQALFEAYSKSPKQYFQASSFLIAGLVATQLGAMDTLYGQGVVEHLLEAAALLAAPSLPKQSSSVQAVQAPSAVPEPDAASDVSSPLKTVSHMVPKAAENTPGAKFGRTVSDDDTRGAALKLISELLPLFVFPLGAKQDLLTACLAAVKDAASPPVASAALQEVALGHLFSILDALHESHAPATVAVFRSVIFTLIELGDAGIYPGKGVSGEEILASRTKTANMLAAFIDKSPGSPVGLAIEALFRQYKAVPSVQLKTSLALCDSNLWLSLAKHARLLIGGEVERNALFLLDTMAGLCLHDPVASRVASLPLLATLHRCSRDFYVVAWSERFFKVALSLLTAQQVPSEPFERKGLQPTAVIADLLTEDPTTIETVRSHVKNTQGDDALLPALLTRSAMIAHLLLRISRLESKTVADRTKELTVEMALAYADANNSEHLALSALLDTWGLATRDIVRGALNKKLKVQRLQPKVTAEEETADAKPEEAGAASILNLSPARTPARAFGEDEEDAGHSTAEEEEEDSVEAQLEAGADWLLKREEERQRVLSEAKAKKTAELQKKREAQQAERARADEEKAKVDEEKAQAKAAKDAARQSLREKREKEVPPHVLARQQEERAAAKVRANSLHPARSFARSAGRVEGLCEVQPRSAAVESELVLESFLPFLERLFAPKLCWPSLKTTLQSLPPQPRAALRVATPAEEDDEDEETEETFVTQQPEDEEVAPVSLLDQLTGASFESDPSIRAAVAANLQLPAGQAPPKSKNGRPVAQISAPSTSKIAQQLKAPQIAEMFRLNGGKNVEFEPVTLDSLLSALTNLELVPHRWSLHQILDIHQLVCATLQAAVDAGAAEKSLAEKRVFSILQAAYAPKEVSSPSSNAQRLIAAQQRAKDVSAADSDAFFAELQNTVLSRQQLLHVLVQLANVAYHPAECVRFYSRGAPVPRPQSTAARRVQALIEDLIDSGLALLKAAEALKADNEKAFGPNDVALWEVRGFVIRDLAVGGVKKHSDKYIQTVLKDLNKRVTRATEPSVPSEDEEGETGAPQETIEDIRTSCPEGFEIRSQVVTSYVPALPPTLPVSPAERVVIGILDDILFEALKLRVLDNYPVQKVKHHASLISAKVQLVPQVPPPKPKEEKKEKEETPASPQKTLRPEPPKTRRVVPGGGTTGIPAVATRPAPPRKTEQPAVAATATATVSPRKVRASSTAARKAAGAAPSLKKKIDAAAEELANLVEENDERKEKELSQNIKPSEQVTASDDEGGVEGQVTAEPSEEVASGEDHVRIAEASAEQEVEVSQPKEEKKPSPKRSASATRSRSLNRDASATGLKNSEGVVTRKEHGANFHPDRKLAPNGKILNPITEEKLTQEQEAKKKKEEVENKRKKHHQKLEEELKDFRAKKEAERQKEEEDKARKQQEEEERAEKARLASERRSEMLKKKAKAKEEKEKAAREAAAAAGATELPPVTSPSKRPLDKKDAKPADNKPETDRFGQPVPQPLDPQAQARAQAAARARMEKAKTDREAKEALNALVTSREVSGTVSAFKKNLQMIVNAFGSEQKTNGAELSMADFVRFNQAFGLALSPVELKGLFKKFMVGGQMTISAEAFAELVLPLVALHLFGVTSDDEKSKKELPTAVVVSAAVQLVCEQLSLHDSVACRNRIHGFQTQSKCAPAFVAAERVAFRLGELKAMLLPPSTEPPPPFAAASAAALTIVQLAKILLPSVDGADVAAQQHQAIKRVQDAAAPLQTEARPSHDDVEGMKAAIGELQDVLLNIAQPLIQRLAKQGLNVPNGRVGSSAGSSSHGGRGGANDSAPPPPPPCPP